MAPCDIFTSNPLSLFQFSLACIIRGFFFPLISFCSLNMLRSGGEGMRGEAVL